jgi:hypothetical protein
MDVEAVLVLGALASVVVGLGGATFISVRRADEEGRHHRLRWALVPAFVSLAAWVVFAYDSLVYSIGENGPYYYPFSTYVEYREALRGHLMSAIVGAGYALLAGAISVAAVTFAVRSDRRRASLVAVVTCLAIGLPGLVPSLLPRSEWGRTAVLSVADGGPYVTSGEREVTACFEYAVESNETGPQIGPADPVLCLTLGPTVEARDLATQDPMTDSGPSIYDVQNDLNSQVTPSEIPRKIDVDGIEIIDAHWKYVR